MGTQEVPKHGYIASDAHRDADGNFHLGPSRRRIGAGFGRRRRRSPPCDAECQKQLAPTPPPDVEHEWVSQKLKEEHQVHKKEKKKHAWKAGGHHGSILKDPKKLGQEEKTKEEKQSDVKYTNIISAEKEAVQKWKERKKLGGLVKKKGTDAESKTGGIFGSKAKDKTVCVFALPQIVGIRGEHLITDIQTQLGKDRVVRIADIVKESVTKCKPHGTMVLPEFKKPPPLIAIKAVKAYVDNGGTVVFADNDVFKVVQAMKIIDDSVNWLQSSDQSDGILKSAFPRFAKCPRTLKQLHGSAVISRSSFKGNALYTTKGGGVLVGQLEPGKHGGQLWYLGFDWYAKTGRDGWARVLAAVIGQ